MYTRRWTNTDFATLHEMLASGSTDKEIATVLDRTEVAVANKRNVVGVHIAKKWTELEDQILFNNTDKNKDELTSLLPRWSECAIKSRRHKLKIRTHSIWTNDDKQFLRENLHLTDIELGKALNRTRSNICQARWRLGLKKRNKKMWTDNEVIFLRAARPKLSFAAIGEYLGRSKASVQGKWTQIRLEST